MATQTVFEFLDTLDRDDALREELGATLGGDALDSPKVAGFAARHGFEFTEDDFNEAVEVIASRQPEELSDDQLDVVSGGSRLAFPMPEGGGKVFRNLGLRLGSNKTIEIVNG
jgi:predicted ribosomally synthesized peptide with nif11-like leader